MWVYDREKGEYRQQTPKNTAVRTHYYSYEDEHGNKDATIESLLAMVEGQAWPVIDKVGERKPLSIKDRKNLALFLAFLKVRVPDHERAIAELSDKVSKAINEWVFESETASQNILESQEKEQEAESCAVGANGPTEFLELERFSLALPRKESLQVMFRTGFEVALHLERMDWIFICAPKNTAFVTSDNPFVIVPPRGHNPDDGIGLVTPGAKKIVPLTSETCLIAYDEGYETVYTRIVPRTEVRTINRSVAAHCDQYVIGRDQELVRKAVESAGVKEKRRGDRVIVERGR